MEKFQWRFTFCFSIILVALLLTSCSSSTQSGPTRPPHMGTFIKDGSKLIELTRIQTHGVPNPNDLQNSPSITNRQPTIIHWQQNTNLQYLGLVSVDPYYQYKTDVSPQDNGIFEISLAEPLNPGINCIVQADPLGWPSSWCFNVR